MIEYSLSDAIIHELRGNRFFAEKCLLLLYEKQTITEKKFRRTIYKNGMGFSRSDGVKLSRMAELLKNNEHLTKTFLKDLRRRLPKYAKQLQRLNKLNLK